MKSTALQQRWKSIAQVLKLLVNMEFAEKSVSSKLEGLDTLLRDRLIGRTPAFGAGYPGSSPGPGANLILDFFARYLKQAAKLCPPKYPNIPSNGKKPSESLEKEFGPNLHQAGRSGTDGLTEGRAVNIPVNRLRSEKLSVIESIECFNPELERFHFGQTQVFQKREIKIVHPGAVKESPSGRSWRSERVLTE